MEEIIRVFGWKARNLSEMKNIKLTKIKVNSIEGRVVVDLIIEGEAK